MHNRGEEPDAESIEYSASSLAASKPVSGEGHIKFTASQLHNQPYQSSSEKPQQQRYLKRQSTVEVALASEQ